MAIGSKQKYTEAARKDSAKQAAETRHAKAEPTALEKQSITALRSKARKKHITGRSTMDKVELILALRQTT